MRQGSVTQRHLRSCPRDAEGGLLEHRCRGSWAFVLEAGRRADGSRRQITKAGFASKREAEAALREVLAREDAGLADIQGLPVAEFLQTWLRGKRRLRDTTRRGYEAHIRRYLDPGVGRIKLAELRPHHIDDLYSDVIEGRYAGATPATVHHVHRTLRSALNTAVKRRLIPWNPALHVELPERRRSQTTVWTPAEVGRFLDVSRQHRLYPLFHLVAFTGLRRGEALGLHWQDVAIDGPHITVRWQVVDAGHGAQLTAPKTQTGARVVPIDRLSTEVLSDHRIRQNRESGAWGAAAVDNDLVFTREDGSMLRPDAISKLFQSLVAAAELPRIRLHDLRHTHASLALAAGVDMKVVSNRLGHSTTAITADLYTHVIPAVARAAAEAIAASVPQSSGPVPSAFLAQGGLPPTDPDPP